METAKIQFSTVLAYSLTASKVLWSITKLTLLLKVPPLVQLLLTTITTTTTTTNYYYYYYDVPGKVVGTATRYGLDGPRFELRWRGGGLKCIGVLYLRKSGWDVALTIHPHIVPKLKKEWRYASTSVLCFPGMLKNRISTFTTSTTTTDNNNNCWIF